MKLKKTLRSIFRRSGMKVPGALLDSDARAMRRMAQLVSKDDIVIDLGAHVGFATIEFAHRAKHVFAFEPNPRNFAELQRNTRNYPNVTLFERAVSDHSGTTRLYFEPTKRGKFFEGATIVEGKSNIGYEQFAEVATMSIADVLGVVKDRIALIKMDIEGAEYQVLEALIASGGMDRIGMIYVECHVDRIPALAEAKARTLAAAKAAGVLGKLDFTWP